jgi:hypothetical protein
MNEKIKRVGRIVGVGTGVAVSLASLCGAICRQAGWNAWGWKLWLVVLGLLVGGGIAWVVARRWRREIDRWLTDEEWARLSEIAESQGRKAGWWLGLSFVPAFAVSWCLMAVWGQSVLVACLPYAVVGLLWLLVTARHRRKWDPVVQFLRERHASARPPRSETPPDGGTSGKLVD